MTLSLRQRSSAAVWSRVAVKAANYVASNVRCLVGDPRLFLMRKVARFEIVRDMVSLSFRPTLKLVDRVGDRPSLFSHELDPTVIAAAIRKDGIFLGITLPQSVVQDILQFASTHPCFVNRDRQRPLHYNYVEKGFQPVLDDTRIGSYLGTEQQCETIRNLIQDPLLLAVAANYLGADPVSMGCELCWSFPVPATVTQQLKAAQVFHYDLDDYRTIKFFFYLLDVDEQSGPHVYIRGSHRNKPLMHQLMGVRCASIDDRKLVECYGEQNVMTICGQSGFGFAEEVIGFHKGTLPTKTPRLLLQLEYTVNNYGNIHEKWSY